MRFIRAVIITLLVCVLLCGTSFATQTTTEYISIPSVTKLIFVAGEVDQKVDDVDIYNPEDNECKIVYELILENGKVIWEGKPLPPGYRYQKITLKEALPIGRYNGIMNARCYDEDGSPLNGCAFEVKILSK